MSRKLRRMVVAVAVVTALAGYALPARAVEVPTDRELSLDECVSIALGEHPKVKGAEQDVKAAEYVTKQAISGFWPRLDFEASRNYVHFERQIRIGGTSATTTADYVVNNFTFNTSWMLFDFGRTYYNVKSFAELENSVLKDLNAAQQRVAYDVMDAYFGLLKAQSLVKVSEETLDVANSHLKQAQAFYEVGVKPKFDVTSAEVEVNDAQVSVISSRDAVKAARADLNTKLGADPLALVMVQERPELEEMNKTLQDYLQEALANRPEVQGLEARVRSSEMAVRAAFAGHLPEVSASAVQNWYKEDHTDFLSNQNAQLTLGVPIFDGFLTTAKVGEARANVLSAKYRLDDLKRDVLLQVSQAYLAVEDAKARVEALGSSVKKAQENLDIAQGRYEAGVGPLIEVTDAQVALTKAKTDLTQAVYDYHLAYTSLLRSVGQGVKE